MPGRGGWSGRGGEGGAWEPSNSSLQPRPLHKKTHAHGTHLSVADHRHNTARPPSAPNPTPKPTPTPPHHPQALKTTNRRVNALENVVKPRLENTISYIKGELDELEREEFFRLKKVQKNKQKATDRAAAAEGGKAGGGAAAGRGGKVRGGVCWGGGASRAAVGARGAGGMGGGGACL